MKKIKGKIINKSYFNFNEFNNDLNLLFDNYILFNKDNELIYKIEQLKEYYEIIIFKYKNIIKLKEEKEIKQEDEETIQGNNKNEKLLNKKRILEY